MHCETVKKCKRNLSPQENTTFFARFSLFREKPKRQTEFRVKSFQTEKTTWKYGGKI